MLYMQAHTVYIISKLIQLNTSYLGESYMDDLQSGL